jgi:NADP-dependent aldehyde dehydrogenase
MEMHGSNILGGELAKSGATTFQAVHAATGEALTPVFYEATEAEVDRALQLAEQAFVAYRRQPAEAIAKFLDAIAAGLEGLGHDLIARAHAETALPEPRLLSERGRTMNQLRMFAALVREGSWVDVRIDRADPGRTPAPKPDLRRMLVPIGPVAVFGASNFPLAFSVCGGDTASALAAGNPVVVKAHPAHPGTSEMAARVVQKAASDCGMPEGVFSMVQGTRPELSLALVRHRSTRAVGFTGSLLAGRALFDAAAQRPSPIPVFAEMGSINPVFVLPHALKERGAELAQSLAKSVTLGVGQFCTKPGLVVGLGGTNLDQFRESLGNVVGVTPPATMLHGGIAARYATSVEQRRGVKNVQLVACTPKPPEAGKTQAQPAVFATNARSFVENPELHEEQFGPSTLVVACESANELEQVAQSLEGQLTVTIHATKQDLKEYGRLIDLVREKAGRVLFGGVPTGVEVVPAMHHGGPYPATTDSRFTSVGTAAILRFVRPVCYQDAPQDYLPPELRDGNLRGIWRLVDGEWTRAPIAAGATGKP